MAVQFVSVSQPQSFALVFRGLGAEPSTSTERPVIPVPCLLQLSRREKYNPYPNAPSIQPIVQNSSRKTLVKIFNSRVWQKSSVVFGCDWAKVYETSSAS